MLSQLLAIIANFVIQIISTLGYPGIIICMAIESALIPLPSEIIMPFSGYLVSTGRFSLLGITLAGGIGNLLGSLLAYILGYWGHEKVVRKLVRKYGKWILFPEHELDKGISWFNQKGEIITFFSRLLPGVRTVISLPAGIARMPLGKFIFYTISGSLIWSFFLGYLGKILGDNWKILGAYFHKLDVVIVVGGLAVVAFYIFHKVREFKAKNHKSKIENPQKPT